MFSAAQSFTADVQLAVGSKLLGLVSNSERGGALAQRLSLVDVSVVDAGGLPELQLIRCFPHADSAVLLRRPRNPHT